MWFPAPCDRPYDRGGSPHSPASTTSENAMTRVILEDRDYTVILAKTAHNFAGSAPPNFEQRWSEAAAAIVTLATLCSEFDPDGITLYVSSQVMDSTDGHFCSYHHVTPDQVDPIITRHTPPSDCLDLLEALNPALDDYFSRKAAQQSKPNGAMIIVLLDGEPKNRMALIKAIVHASQKMDQDRELGIGFVQVGDDLIARGFLNSLDHDLRSQAGAKFDIVHTRVLETIELNCLTDFLTDIIQN